MQAWLVFASLALAATAGHADTIDKPTRERTRLRGSSTTSGEITTTAGFHAHTYTASRDGFARVTLVTANDDADANDGRAWRPYLRVISLPSPTRRGEGWSTNGRSGSATSARASLVFRVHAGEQFTIIATLAENVAKARPAADASYEIAIDEVGP